jgi:hypothetical protein
MNDTVVSNPRARKAKRDHLESRKSKSQQEDEWEYGSISEDSDTLIETNRPPPFQSTRRSRNNDTKYARVHYNRSATFSYAGKIVIPDDFKESQPRDEVEKAFFEKTQVLPVNETPFQGKERTVCFHLLPFLCFIYLFIYLV